MVYETLVPRVQILAEMFQGENEHRVITNALYSLSPSGCGSF